MKRYLARAAIATAACAIGLLTTTGPANAAEGWFVFEHDGGTLDVLFNPDSHDCLILSDGTTPSIVYVFNGTDKKAHLFDNLLCSGEPVDSVPKGTEAEFKPEADVKTVWFGYHP